VFASPASRRRGVIYAALLAVCFLLLATSGSAPVRELQRGLSFALSPIQGALSGAPRSATSAVGAIFEIERLRQENERLAARIEALEVENRRLEEVRIQNEQLSRLLKVKGALDYETVAASVISRQINDYERIITIDQGTDRGIQVGDVAVAGGAALVGRVVDAGPNYSRILLINDTRSTVIGLVESTRATGNVVGQPGGALMMEDVAATERVNLDDQVVTAGIDLGAGVRSPFPKGLLIGRVIDVQRDPNAVVQTSFVAPAADLDKLEYVLVITNYEGVLQPSPLPSSPSAATAPPAPEETPGDSAPAADDSPLATPVPLPDPSLMPAP
jgi:rod shape-determining protein MreC